MLQLLLRVIVVAVVVAIAAVAAVDAPNCNGCCHGSRCCARLIATMLRSIDVVRVVVDEAAVVVEFGCRCYRFLFIC